MSTPPGNRTRHALARSTGDPGFWSRPGPASIRNSALVDSLIEVALSGGAGGGLSAAQVQALIDVSITAHEAEADPHQVYLTQPEATLLYPLKTDPNPFPQYVTQAEGDLLYAPIGSGGGGGGSTILTGTGPPSTSEGEAGDFYIDTVTGIMYGPKLDASDPYKAPEYATPDALFPASATPSAPLELAVQAQFAVPGIVTAVRYYRQASMGTAHTVSLWNKTTGLRVATASIANDGGGTKWVEVALPTPYAVTAGQIVVASYDFQTGSYSRSDGAVFPVSNGGNVTLVGMGYGTTLGAYPSTQGTTPAFFADVLFRAEDTLIWPIAINPGTGGGAGATPGGATTQVQFNDGGVFGGDGGFTYNKATDTALVGSLGLTAGGKVSTPGIGIFESVGGTYGMARLVLIMESGTAGAMFETVPIAGAELVDFVFKTTGGQDNFRYERRTNQCIANNNYEFQIGPPSSAYLRIGNTNLVATKPLMLQAGNPVDVLHAAPKQYVDAAVAAYLPLAGGTLTGNLGIGSPVTTPVGTNDRVIQIGTAQIRGDSTKTASGWLNLAFNSYYNGSITTSYVNAPGVAIQMTNQGISFITYDAVAPGVSQPYYERVRMAADGDLILDPGGAEAISSYGDINPGQNLGQNLGNPAIGSRWGTLFAGSVTLAVTPAVAGAVRLGNTGTVSWRNAGNTADYTLGVNASNNLASSTHITPSGNNTLDLGLTGTRWRKLWGVDIESTNAPTVGGVALPTFTTADARYLRLTGGTLTGDLIRNGADLTDRTISFQTNGAMRWRLGIVDTQAEGAPDTGGDFKLQYYWADGTPRTLLAIDRDVGQMVFTPYSGYPMQIVGQAGVYVQDTSGGAVWQIRPVGIFGTMVGDSAARISISPDGSGIKFTNGTANPQFTMQMATDGSLQVYGDAGAGVMPLNTGAMDLGRSDRYWKKLWAVDAEFTNTPTVLGLRMPGKAQYDALEARIAALDALVARVGALEAQMSAGVNGHYHLMGTWRQTLTATVPVTQRIPEEAPAA